MMSGFGRVWKAFTGGGAAPPEPPPLSTIAREVVGARPAAPEPPWDPVESEPGDTREADRFVPHRTATVLTTVDGKRVPARIINLSRTGVAVETGATRVDAADVTLVGTRPVTPGRRIALGQVFLFNKPLDPKLCGPEIVL